MSSSEELAGYILAATAIRGITRRPHWDVRADWLSRAAESEQAKSSEQHGVGLGFRDGRDCDR